MKSYVLLSILFLSFNSFGQSPKIINRKIIKVETNMTAGDSTGSVSLKMDTSLLIFDDLLKPGKYKFILQIKNCKVTLMKNRLKEYQLTQEFLDQIDTDLAKYQVEHYLNGKLLPDCDKIDCYSFPIFVQIPEE